MKSLSCARVLVTPWNAAYQAPLSMGFSRQEYWSGLPLPSPPRTWVTGKMVAPFMEIWKSGERVGLPVNTGFPSGSDSKDSVCNVGDWGSIPGLGRSPGGGLGNPLHYSLSGESAWTGEPGRPQSMGSQRVGHDWATKHTHTCEYAACLAKIWE